MARQNPVETFKTLFPSDYKFEGNRAIVFDESALVPTQGLRFCIVAALTYQQRKAAARSRWRRRILARVRES